MTYPIEVSNKCYQDIQASLERYWNSTPWPRIWSGNKRGTYKEVTSRFDLIIEEVIDFCREDIHVKLVSKEDPEVIPYDEVFDKYLGKIEVGK